MVRATLKRTQRGDSDFLVFVLLLFVLFWGEPDVWDALQHWAMMTGNDPRCRTSVRLLRVRPMSALRQTTPLPLGSHIPGYGVIGAVGYTGDERYYWMCKSNSVAMIPASIIEPLVRTSSKTPDAPK